MECGSSVLLQGFFQHAIVGRARGDKIAAQHNGNATQLLTSRLVPLRSRTWLGLKGETLFYSLNTKLRRMMPVGVLISRVYTPVLRLYRFKERLHLLLFSCCSSTFWPMTL